MSKKKKAPKIIEFPNEYKVCGADLSLRRPGWCILTVKDKKIIDVKLFSLDNKAKNKTHGQILTEIYDVFYNNVIKETNTATWFYVREKMVMLVKVPSERDVAKVVGLMDFMLGDKEWNEIYPTTVKKLITGSGKAQKTEVAIELSKYIGTQNYKCDDESDAAAVAVAWLIQQEQIKQIDNSKLGFSVMPFANEELPF